MSALDSFIIIYGRLSRSNTVRGSCTGPVTVGPTKASKFISLCLAAPTQ